MIRMKWFQRNDSRQEVAVWGRMCGNGISLGSYFFKEMLLEKTTLKY